MNLFLFSSSTRGPPNFPLPHPPPAPFLPSFFPFYSSFLPLTLSPPPPRPLSLFLLPPLNPPPHNSAHRLFFFFQACPSLCPRLYHSLSSLLSVIPALPTPLPLPSTRGVVTPCRTGWFLNRWRDSRLGEGCRKYRPGNATRLLQGLCELPSQQFVDADVFW